jgi:hypothetical protein
MLSSLIGILVLPALGGAELSIEVAYAGAKKPVPASGVVVWLEAGRLPPRPPVRAQILQKAKKFQPHVLAVPLGSTVDFPNLDPIFHNAFSNFNGKVFDIGLYSPGSSRAVRFDRPGIVRIFCNIHPEMSAVVAVLDTPNFGVTDAAGRLTIEGVEPGEYRLRLFAELAPQAANLSRQLKIGTADVKLPTITVPAAPAGIPAHKNKYGNDYPSGSPAEVSYPYKRP